MNIKQALTRKLGPFAAWQWLILVGGGVMLYRHFHTSSTSSSTTAATGTSGSSDLTGLGTNDLGYGDSGGGAGTPLDQPAPIPDSGGIGSPVVFDPGPGTDPNGNPTDPNGNPTDPNGNPTTKKTTRSSSPASRPRIPVHVSGSAQLTPQQILRNEFESGNIKITPSAKKTAQAAANLLRGITKGLHLTSTSGRQTPRKPRTATTPAARRPRTTAAPAVEAPPPPAKKKTKPLKTVLRTQTSAPAAATVSRTRALASAAPSISTRTATSTSDPMGQVLRPAEAVYSPSPPSPAAPPPPPPAPAAPPRAAAPAKPAAKTPTAPASRPRAAQTARNVRAG